MRILWIFNAILLLIGVFINPLGIVILLAAVLMLAREPLVIENDSD